MATSILERTGQLGKYGTVAGGLNQGVVLGTTSRLNGGAGLASMDNFVNTALQHLTTICQEIVMEK
jgi:hypothetical protein